MTGYRRNFVAGGSFFFTVNLADRRLQLLTESIDALRTAFRETQRHHPFTIDAIVVLPDHLHSVWTLPEGDADFSTRWRLIKTSFSRKLSGGEPISSSRAGKANAVSGSDGIGNTRFAMRTIFRATSITFIFNPVKHGLVTRVRDWPHSSFHRMVRHGIYPEDWAGDVSGLDGEFGERR